MTKTVFVTISGRTNVGKSSLLNAIVGERIASVSNKPQTTRTRITGIKTVGEIQMVFMDTPGLHKPKNKLSTYMLQAAKEAVNDMDVVLFVADCTRQPTEQELEFLQPLKAVGGITSIDPGIVNVSKSLELKLFSSIWLMFFKFTVLKFVVCAKL